MLGLNWYRNFLFVKCNPRTGEQFWKWIELCGLLMVFSWVFAVAPLVGHVLNIDWLGVVVFDLKASQFVAYKGLFTISDNAMNWYWLWALWGVVILKLGLLAQALGNNYKNNYVYLKPFMGHPLGEWVPKKTLKKMFIEQLTTSFPKTTTQKHTFKKISL